MMPVSDSSPSKPTLESLLRLKRTERPDDAFWGEFEVRMRQKQLAASIEPKPWWLVLALLARRFSTPAMTGMVGAAGAAAVMGFMVVRSASSLEEGGYVVVQAGDPVAVATQAANPQTMVVADVRSLNVVQPVKILADATMATESFVDEAILAADPAPSVESGEMIVLADTEIVRSEFTPSLILTAQVKLVDDVFAFLASRLDTTSWTVAQLVSPLEDFDTLAMLNVEASVPDFALGEAIGSVPAPSSRLEQLLAMDEGKPAANKSLGQVRDRVLHRFGGDDELYASVSRLGVGGDRLSLRF